MDTKKLRQKILDLAIRGKLVPQNPNDEPASVLIEKIRVEKEKLIKEKKIKRDKNESYIYRSDKSYYEKFTDGTVKCIDEEIPFEIPESWEWCRLGAIAFYKKGPFGSSITKSMFISESKDAIKIYEQKNAIYKDVEIGGYYISNEKFDELKGFQVFPDDIIVSCAGTIGETYVMPKQMRKGIINQALMRIKLYNHEILDFYLLYFDFVLKNQANEQGKGTAIKNIPPFDILKNFLIPLPPIEEQYRMRNFIKTIAKDLDSVDENRNAISVLVAQTKSKVLDLAIRGKLVPQNPNDEPASILLERIKAEHPESKKKAKNISDNSHYRNLPFEIPENWMWTTLGDLCNYGKCRSINADQIPSNGWILDLEDIEKDTGRLLVKVHKDQRATTSSKHIFKEGNVLYSKLRTYLNKVVIAEQDGYCTSEIIPLDFGRYVNPEYARYVLMSNMFLRYTAQCGYGVKMPRLGTNDGRRATFPLPPLKEQYLIVNKIEQTVEVLSKVMLELFH